MSNQSAKVLLADKPVESSLYDFFGFKGRIVKNIHNFLKINLKPSIIAITGPLGSGKTSAMNLLREEIESDYNCISFDPIIECKFEIAELLETFLLKLSVCINEKDNIKKLMKLIMILSPSKFSLGLSQHGVGFEWEKIDERINNLFNFFKDKDASSFSKQIKKVNSAIKESGKKIVVFIDEIDRLNAEDIIKFLVFARALEAFDEVQCIVSFDYDLVLLKLSNYFNANQVPAESKMLELDKVAIKYLEKFFHVRYEVCGSLKFNKLYQYADELLKFLGIQLLDSHPIEHQHEIEKNNIFEVINLLKTPRNIKRWVMELIRIRALIRPGQKNKSFWLSLAAIFIVNPQCLAKFSQERKEFVFPKNLGLSRGIEMIYAENIKMMPTLHIQAFLENDLEDESRFNLIDDFFEGIAINDVLERFLDGNEDDRAVVEDIAEKILRHNEKVSENVRLDLILLLKLWEKFIEPNDIPYLELIYNPYYIIILDLLSYIPDNKEKIEKISKCSLVLGEKYLIKLLEKHGIKNTEGKYDLLDKADLIQYVNAWLSVEKPIFSNEINDSSMLSMISVCYRYLQWSRSVGNNVADAMKNLVQEAIDYFGSVKVEDKCKINFLKAVSSGFGFGENHLEKLFNRDPKLISILKEYADRNGLQNLENYSRMFPDKKKS